MVHYNQSSFELCTPPFLRVSLVRLSTRLVAQFSPSFQSSPFFFACITSELGVGFSDA